MDRRIVKTRKAIRNAFAQLLSQKDMQEITIKDIAETADINRKTFYAHYTGVHQVIDEIENDIVSDFGKLLHETDLKRCLKNPSDILEKLSQTINGDIDFYGNLMKMNRNSSLISKIIQEIKTSFVESLNEQFSLDAFSVDVLADFVVSGMLAVFQNWFNSSRTRSIEELSKKISLVAMFGVNGLLAG